MNILDRQAFSVSPMINLNAFANRIERASMMEVKAEVDYDAEYNKSIDGGIDAYGIAHIFVCGEIYEMPSRFARWCDIAVPSAIQKLVRKYKNDHTCKEIYFHFSTGGGSISTVPDLADEIFDCDKPTTAIVKEQCCSAGYWLASQCKKIIAYRGATIGALGVYLALADTSEAMAKEGIKVHLFATGDLKGLGEYGTPLTDAQINFLQAYINRSGSMFLADIKRARPSFSDSLFNGAFWHAVDALKLGLIDDVLI